MNALRALSQILFAVPVVMFFYDLVKGWFVEAHVQIRSFQQWWVWLSPTTMEQGRLFFGRVLPAKQLDAMMHLPGFAVMLAPPVFLYVLYRLWFAAAGGKKAGAFKYKSRH